MGQTTIFSVLSLSSSRRRTRIVILIFFTTLTITAILFIQLQSHIVYAGHLPRSLATLKLALRDSMTGQAVHGQIAWRNTNGAAKPVSRSVEGRGSYELASGPYELEITAPGYNNLRTHFEIDSESPLSATVWLDPETVPEELRAEVITAKVRTGHVFLHGHVVDSETGIPIKGARIHLEQAGVESQTDSRGYFQFYAPAPAVSATDELPKTDNLVVDLEGYAVYRRTNIPLAAGPTHYIIDMGRGEGVTEKDDRHKLMLSPDELRNAQAAVAEAVGHKANDGKQSTRDSTPRPLSVTVPASIRVGSNCSCKTCCTTFNVYSLDTYVRNGLDDEWFSSWNANSLKAGAIAYRSYGVYYVYHPLTANYDICNTTSCQVNDPTDSATSTNNATANTAGMIVVDSTGNNPFFAEYAAENNDNSCPDGFTGSPSANWPCMSDIVDAGQTFNGHGRGMCQWGTQRWAVNQGKDFEWIVNHYYNNNGNPSGARSGVLQAASFSLTVASSNPGSGVSVTVSPVDNNSQGNGATQFTRTYANNTRVNLTAPSVASGNNFQKWQRNGVDWTTSASTSVVVDASLTMTAVYVAPQAGTGQWTTNGPAFSDVTSLAIDPQNPLIVYAGTNGAGVFKTMDGGTTWNAVNSGLGNATVRSLAVDPSNPLTLYAGVQGTNGGGVFKSTNGGNGWSPMSAGLEDSLVNALAIDPSTPSTIYAGAEPFSFDGGGVFKSTNGAGSWSRMSSGITTHFIGALAVDRINAQVIYAGSPTLGGGMFKSVDGGSNWINIGTGLGNDYVNVVAIDPVTTSTLYVGTPSGVYRSTNGGGAWQAVNNGLLTTWPVRALAIDPSRPSTIYAGTSISFGTSNRGVFRSIDRGDNWTPIDNGLANTNISSLVTDRSGAYLYSGSRPSQIAGAVSSYRYGSVEFTLSAWGENEATGQVTIQVARSGDLLAFATVDYETSDGGAKQKTDYTTASGTLSFGPGDSSKSFVVLVTDNVYQDGSRTLNLRLTNPTGATLGSVSNAVLTIADNDTVVPLANPLDTARFFAQQHYYDFLSRYPDPGGLDFWANEITLCGSDVPCLEVKRINVSAAFFLSIEFQETGYLVYRMYKSGFGNLAGAPVPVRYADFLHDTQRIGQGVQVGIGNWQAQLEANKQAYALAFVQRPDFLATFPNSMTGDQFVTQLDTKAGGVLSAVEKTALVNLLGVTPADVTKRASVLRSVAEDPDLKSAEFNKAFVLMQYFGYLRRNPNDAPDADYSGFNFWLNKLNQFGGNFVNAEMVKAFIISTEYRQRFGP